MELSAVVIALALTAAAVAVGLLRAHRGRARGDDGPTPPLPTSSPDRLSATPDQRDSQLLVDWLVGRAREQTGVDVGADGLALQRIAEAARTAREELRSQASVTVSLPFLTADATGPKHFEIQVTREALKASAARPARR